MYRASCFTVFVAHGMVAFTVATLAKRTPVMGTTFERPMGQCSLVGAWLALNHRSLWIRLGCAAVVSLYAVAIVAFAEWDTAEGAIRVHNIIACLTLIAGVTCLVFTVFIFRRYGCSGCLPFRFRAHRPPIYHLVRAVTTTVAVMIIVLAIPQLLPSSCFELDSDFVLFVTVVCCAVPPIAVINIHRKGKMGAKGVLIAMAIGVGVGLIPPYYFQFNRQYTVEWPAFTGAIGVYTFLSLVLFPRPVAESGSV